MSLSFNPIKSLALAAICAASSSSLLGATYNVDFEGTGETKTAYASANVTLNGIAWNLNEALIGTDASDYKVGARSVRLRGYTASAMTMQADKANGAGTISFTYQRYGTDSQIAWAVEISSTGGTSWAQVGTDFTGAATVQTFNETVNLSGNVRVRIIAKATNTSNKRLNIDNISITDNTAPDTTPPTISTYSPADDATGVALDSNLVATFSEPVAVGSGTVRLYAVGNPTAIQTFTPVAGDISGAVVTLNPTADLIAGTSYYVQIDAGAFTDVSLNNFAGISNNTTWSFSTVAADSTPPTVASLAPADDAAGVAVDANLAVTFSEPVLASTGSVKLYAVGNPTPVATFAASSGAIVGNTVTFDPPTNLSSGSAYYVQIEATAFTDTATPANAFAGILDAVTWNFTTAGADTSAPLVTALSPANNATNVALDASLSITFSEPVFTGTGNLSIYQTGNPTPVETIAAGDAGITDNVVTLNPNNDFTAGATYYIQADAGMFTDAALNPMAAITGTTSWTFTTIPPDTTAPLVTGVTPLNGATDVSLTQPLTVSFDEPIARGTGFILIKKASDNSTVATLDVEDTDVVSLSDSQANLLLVGSLPPNATLYVEIPAGAFTDTSSNPAAAYGGSGVWSFTTVVMPELTLAGPYTQDFSTFTAANQVLPPGWTVTSNGSASNKYALSAWHTATTASTDTGIKFSSADPVVNVLGYQHSGDTDLVTKSVTLVNSTGGEITALTISYHGRRARADVGRTPNYVVSVNGQAVPELAYDTEQGDNWTVTASVPGLNIPAGGGITISWASNGDTASGSGTREQIGISDVSVAAGSALLPPSLTGVVIDYATLTSSGVSVSSEVISNGGSALTGRGFVYSITSVNSAPEIAGTGVTQMPDAAATVGAMSVALSGLTPATQYSVRSYATNAQGTTYSSAFTLHTLAVPPSLVTSYTQAFNAFNGTILNGTLPAGWSVVSSGGLNGYAGPWGPATSSGGLVGGVSSPGVLGYQHVTTSGTATVTLTLVNDTGSTLTELWVSYLGRVERITETRFPEWTVSVNGTVVPELGYSTGTAANATKTHQVTGLSIAPGASFAITWVSDRGTNAGGSSRQIGIADVYVGLTAPTSGYSGWASSNTGGAPADQDTDGDGIDNGVEYFMGTAGNAPTQNPSIVNNKITWPMNPSATGVTYKVMTSENMTTWTQATTGVQVIGGNLEFTVPQTAPKLFIRLEVTVN